MTQFAKKNENIFFQIFLKILKISFLAQKRVNGFFSEKSDSATFYPLYPPNFMQNKLDKSMDPHKLLLGVTLQ